MPNRFMVSRRASQLLPLLALPLLSCTLPALGQTTISPVGTKDGSAVAVPGGPTRSATRVIVAAAVDTSGNAETAKKALAAANAALGETPGYAPVAVSDYAAAKDAAAKMKDVDWAWPFTSTDYQKIGKAFGASSKKSTFDALTITVTPNGGTYGAAAELYDTKTGGLIGYGAGVSVDGADPLNSAVAHAVIALSNTATFNAVVLSKPGGYNTRISIGEQSGARAGSRVEYLQNGVPIAFGTILDLGYAESVATVAPETAFPAIGFNTPVRVVNTPTAKRALPSQTEVAAKDQAKFERGFAIAAGIATAVYYLSN